MVRPSARYEGLLRVSRKRGCSREDAEDLVQEAHCRWWAYQLTGAKVRDSQGLLRRIVVTLSINHYRRCQRPASMAVPRADRLGLLADPRPGPERTLEAEQELEAAVAWLCAASSRRTCQTFLMQRAGYSYEDLACAFAVKPRTVEKRVAIAAEEIAEVGRMSNQPAVQDGKALQSLIQEVLAKNFSAARPQRVPLVSRVRGSELQARDSSWSLWVAHRHPRQLSAGRR